MSHRVTLSEAAVELSVPYDTLKTWKKRGLIHPAGLILYPRRATTYDLDELERIAAATTRRTPQSTDT